MIQIRWDGFGRNHRQMRAAQLSVVEMCQTLRIWGGSRGGCAEWREWWSICARWRAVATPSDGVCWVDQLPAEDFNRGFGIATPTFSGQCKVLRYHVYFERHWANFVQLNLDTNPHSLNQHQLDQLQELGHLPPEHRLSSAHAIFGRDVYVTMPAESTRDPTVVLEGARLTLQAWEPGGYTLTLRIAGQPSRSQQFGTELQAGLERVLQSLEQLRQHGTPDPCQQHGYVDQVLSMLYYWAIFSGITRGTAIAMYCGLASCLAAAHLWIEPPQPAGFQMDMEAIFSRSPQEFIECVKPWVSEQLRGGRFIPDAPSLAQSCVTLRHHHEALNLDS
eukprot:TRINITY_DN20540_c0_g1_i1.p1 TRINITY_DN20540_c0_g1~~TRINITY_DN20540_c0_g1_i1.p1  ORF type:complete len:333 (+),score=70.59 TRINITY_DN20540_c0_g1_i1:272-1270(+)